MKCITVRAGRDAVRSLCARMAAGRDGCRPRSMDPVACSLYRSSAPIAAQALLNSAHSSGGTVEAQWKIDLSNCISTQLGCLESDELI